MMERTKNGFLVAFLAIALALLIAPFALMPLVAADGTGTSADEDLAEWPALIEEDGSFNAAFLSEAGAWFESHFALRSDMLQSDQNLRGLLGATTSEKVVAGNDGWLYYSGTLADYEGTSPLTDRQLETIAYNLQLAQGYVQSRGATFTLTLAPNKNTLYPEHMPSRFVESLSEHNAERLVSHLNNRGVSYVDLLSTLKSAAASSDTNLYYAKDTHWNELGASVGFDALMSGMGLAHRTFGTGDFTWADSDTGDLNVMINPAGGVTESVPVLARARGFAFLGGVEDVEEAVVETVSVTDEAAINGTLLMYRDSFGNNLLPYMAEAFSRAYFTKYTPYDLTLLSTTGARHVVIERAERNLYSFASNPPVMPAPTAVVVPVGEVASDTTVSAAADGTLWKIEGWFAGVSSDESSPVYVAIEREGDASSRVSYVAFRTEKLSGSTDTASDAASSEETVEEGTSGFMLHVSQADLPAGNYRVSVVISIDSRLVTVAQTALVL